MKETYPCVASPGGNAKSDAREVPTRFPAARAADVPDSPKRPRSSSSASMLLAARTRSLAANRSGGGGSGVAVCVGVGVNCRYRVGVAVGVGGSVGVGVGAGVWVLLGVGVGPFWMSSTTPNRFRSSSTELPALSVARRIREAASVVMACGPTVIRNAASATSACVVWDRQENGSSSRSSVSAWGTSSVVVTASKGSPFSRIVPVTTTTSPAPAR